MAFKENDWVYIVDMDNDFAWHIHPAIVTNYSNKKVTASYAVPFKGYMLDGKPLEEMEKWSTEWKKCPKDHKDITKEIYNHIIEPKILMEEVYKNTPCSDHKTCQYLVDIGVIVPKTFRTPWIDSELSKDGKEYRLVLKWVDMSNNTGRPCWRNGRGGYHVTEDKVFYTHAEAVNKVNEIKAEAKRFASLSELEQCLEEHERYLSKYFDKETVNMYLNKIKFMDRAEDIEIRVSKKWNNEGKYVVYWCYFEPYKVKPAQHNNNYKETKAEREARNEEWIKGAKDRWFAKWKELNLCKDWVIIKMYK